MVFFAFKVDKFGLFYALLGTRTYKIFKNCLEFLKMKKLSPSRELNPRLQGERLVSLPLDHNAFLGYLANYNNSNLWPQLL